MPYPKMFRVRQAFEAPRLDDVPGTIRREFARIRIGERVRAGQSVAIGVGSRGITDLARIVRTLVDALRDVGAAPFIVPAMGSHGGATAEGQQRVLATYGVTEDAMGVPIRAAMDVVDLGATEDGVPLLWERTAYEADHLVVVNRIKPHTSFAGTIESGLLKMITIGLGQHVGAAAIHRASVTLPWERLVETAGRALLARGKITFGLAIVENAYDQTALIEAVPSSAIFAREPELLTLARAYMPRLPLDRADLLIVDQMGKNISGLGMDTNVTGRKPGVSNTVRMARVFVRELAPESHGNAHGLGLADFTTTRLVRAMDRRMTAINSLAAVHPEAGMIPIHFDTDREAIDAALATIGLKAPTDARIIRIKNTLALGEVEVSEPCQVDLRSRPDLQVLEPSHPLTFDPTGNLLPLA